MFKTHDCTAMSTAEAEYVALSASCAQVMWMITQLKDYGFDYNRIPLYYDFQSAIAISCNPVEHSRTKHINVRYHLIKEQVEHEIVEMDPDIENITLSEYLEYEAEKERRSKRNPTKYDEADFDSFHQDKSSTFDYPYYHDLPPLRPSFQSSQPYIEDGLVSSNKSDEVDIDSMTLAEYELYITKSGAESLKGMKQEEAKVEECDEGNINDIWDITIEDVKRLR
ncbi:hypothetical protein Tco_1219257 [Tanacetum coccineum]